MIKVNEAIKNLKKELSGYKWLESIGLYSSPEKTIIMVNINTKLTKTIEKTIPPEFGGFPTQINEVTKKVNYVIGV